jgi:hypothetical protein
MTIKISHKHGSWIETGHTTESIRAIRQHWIDNGITRYTLEIINL